MTRTKFEARILGLLLIAVLLAAATASPAGAEQIYVASNQVQIYDAASGKQVAALELGKFVSDIVFNADGSRAYFAVPDGVLEVDATTHAVLGRLVEGPSFDLDLSRDGRLLYILGNDVRRLPDGQQEALPSRITVFDLESRTVAAREEVGMRAEEMALVGERAAVTRPNAFELALVGMGAETASTRTTFGARVEGQAAPGFIHGLAVAPDGKRIYLGQFGDQSAIHVLDGAGNAREALPFRHEGFITGVELTPDGRTLAVALRNHLALLDAASGAERAFIPLGGAHMKMALSPDGKRSYHSLPTYDERGGAVTVVDLASGKVERTIPTAGISAVTIGIRP